MKQYKPRATVQAPSPKGKGSGDVEAEEHVKQTYQGACHCGKVRFEVDTELDQVRVCDCSICRRRGALNHRVAPESFRLLTPLYDLSRYQFNTHTATDYFCPTCGILPFRRPRTDPSVWAVNVRCLEGVDLDSIPVKRVYGSRLT